MRIKILVEEESMKVFIETIFPRICDTSKWAINENVFVRPFEGKSHLKKELPKKAKVYSQFHEPVFMLVLQDQDSSNCMDLKQKLIELIAPTGLTSFKIRIVCKELECWYLGDLDAVEIICPTSKAGRLKSKSKFKNPELLNGKEEIKNWVYPYSAIEFAKQISTVIDVESNRSLSFRHTIKILQSVTE